MNRQRLLERFLRYVQVGTTAIEGTSSYPSSPGQLELGRVLIDELLLMNAADIKQDENGLVYATIPATVEGTLPAIVFNAHLDTSPETTGQGVQPQVINDYAGGDISLPGDASRVIRVADNRELEQLIGATIITSDGTTLLGGDDKAGIAIIMELAQTLLEDPSLTHGPVRVLFTCDEEIGRGVDFVDVPALAAAACYTFDGGGANEIDVETFSADSATVTLKGINIHPSIAKGRMTNALRMAGCFLEKLPRELSPECTSDRQGFLHPYTIEGGVAEVKIKILLRDFDTEALEIYKRQLEQAAQQVEAQFDNGSVEVEVHSQYRNLAAGLAKEPRAVAFAKEAHERLGRKAKLSVIRGGTDGSAFTSKGLPTPNLSSGQHNPHSPLEWACLDEMVQAVEVGLQICRLWAEES